MGVPISKPMETTVGRTLAVILEQVVANRNITLTSEAHAHARADHSAIGRQILVLEQLQSSHEHNFDAGARGSLLH